jgi:hypothetical protein
MDGSWVADDASLSCFDCAVAFLASLPARLVAVLPQNPNPLLLFLSNLHSIFFQPHHKQNSMNDIGVRHPWKGWEPESNWLILRIGSCRFSFAPHCQRHTEVHTYTATLHPPRQGSCGKMWRGHVRPAMGALSAASRDPSYGNPESVPVPCLRGETVCNRSRRGNKRHKIRLAVRGGPELQDHA